MGVLASHSDILCPKSNDDHEKSLFLKLIESTVMKKNVKILEATFFPPLSFDCIEIRENICREVDFLSTQQCM